MQYAFFTVLGIVLMVLLYYDEAIRTVVLGAILGIPYLFLSTAALLLILPQNLLLYLPSFVLMPHFAMSALLYVTNSDFLFKIQPIILTLILWPFTTAAIVILLIILFVQRKHVTNSITQKEPDKG
ncbi:MAG: hypothetical protein JW749_00010 [Sedimentisphaerales bacterium]|nr:hypothetical protein [Sedimentisphaerales bacterium]